MIITFVIKVLFRVSYTGFTSHRLFFVETHLVINLRFLFIFDSISFVTKSQILS